MKLTELSEKFDNYINLKYQSKDTISTYTNCFWKFINSNSRVYRMSKSEIETYLVKFKNTYSISYYNQMLSTLYIVYGKVLKQPSKVKGLAMLKQPDTLQNVLNVDQVRAAVRKANNLKHKVVISVLYLCGLRVSELLSLELKDIDSKNSRLKVVGGKGRRDRYIPITDKLIIMLNKYTCSYSPRKYLVEGSPFRKYSASSVRSICKRSGVDNPHLLRHSIITHLIDSGDQQTKVQLFAGHKSSKSTLKYYHLAFNSLNSLSLPT